MSGLTLLHAYSNLTEAEMALATLEGAGFAAFLLNTNAMNYEVMPITRPYRLMVLEDQLADASKLLASAESSAGQAEASDESGINVPPDLREACPSCGSTDVDTLGPMLSNFVRSLRGRADPEAQSPNRRCRNCGAKWHATPQPDETN